MEPTKNWTFTPGVWYHVFQETPKNHLKLMKLYFSASARPTPKDPPETLGHGLTVSFLLNRKCDEIL
jgi:hypothetical protein